MSFQAMQSGDQLVPDGAFQAGWEGDHEPLYAARVHLSDSCITPAKVGKTTGRGALYCSDWKEQYSGNYEAFVSDGQGLAWKDASGVPDPNLKPLDFGTDQGQPLYLAQIEVNGTLNVGKCGPSLTDGAHYGYGGKEEVAQNYKVLCTA